MDIRKDLVATVGNTPLIRLNAISEETGCEILGKAEFMNPGQSVKDRAALYIIRDAVARGDLQPGGTIVEGTAGNTGIGLSLVGAAMGFKTVIVIPETQSQEKKDMIRLAGAELVQVPACPYKNPNNYVHYSRRLAAELAKTEPNGAVWANQSDVLVYGDELSRLFESDDFKLVEGEKDRLAQIDQVMSGFDIDAFLDRLDVKLNPVQVYNVANVPQPFWPASCTAHRLLVWCLFKKGRVRFIEGAITGYEADEAQKALHIRRKLAGKTRRINPSGVVIRHGVGQRHAGFLKIQGVLDEESRSHEDIANDGRRLVALLRLSNTLHPETEKFFRHTIKHLK